MDDQHAAVTDRTQADVHGRHEPTPSPARFRGLVRQLWQDERVAALMRASDETMRRLGYTEHSWRHCALVARNAERILEELGYPAERCEEAGIAGMMHDLGNAVRRDDHEQLSCIFANEILADYPLSFERRLVILTAIANHDEGVGFALNPAAAALILADKSDVHRSRVTADDLETFDIHDQVNYAVSAAALRIDAEAKRIILELEVDTEIAPIMAYFEIFTKRMQMCRHAAEALGLDFGVRMNEVVLL